MFTLVLAGKLALGLFSTQQEAEGFARDQKLRDFQILPLVETDEYEKKEGRILEAARSICGEAANHILACRGLRLWCEENGYDEQLGDLIPVVRRVWSEELGRAWRRDWNQAA